MGNQKSTTAQQQLKIYQKKTFFDGKELKTAHKSSNQILILIQIYNNHKSRTLKSGSNMMLNYHLLSNNPEDIQESLPTAILLLYTNINDKQIIDFYKHWNISGDHILCDQQYSVIEHAFITQRKEVFECLIKLGANTTFINSIDL